MFITQEAKNIAVQMWESIRDNWLKNSRYVNLSMYKHVYLKDTPFKGKWNSDCLLCEYYNNDCSHCPLQNCEYHGTTYNRVHNRLLPMQDRIDACNKIIESIKNIPVIITVVTHGKLWVLLHCKRTYMDYTYNRCSAKLLIPDMFKDLVGKKLEISIPYPQDGTDYIGYALTGKNWWVPKWLVKKVMAE